jgi:8-oxo-dGTP pyrophosphatase MutT (NUDIX family)
VTEFLDRLRSELVPIESWGSFRDGARAAAVVAVLYRRRLGGEAEWNLPFVLRRSDLPHHPGQVALPGGMVRPGEDAWAAARREVREELGIAEDELVPIGAGRVVYAAVSNFSVAPFMAVLQREDPGFIHDARELDGVIEVPLERLLAEEAWMEDPDTWLGRHFPWQSSIVWGLTARILGDLLPRLGRALAASEPMQDPPGPAAG